MNEILDHVDINPRKLGHGRGSAPYRRSDWTSRLWAMSKNRTVKNDVPVCARSLSWLSWISELSGTPRSYASRSRNCALQRAPVRWTLALKTNHLWGSGPCQSRNITEQRVETHVRGRAEFPQRSTNWPRDTRNEGPNQHIELTRKTKPNIQPASTTESKYNKLNIPNSDWTGKNWSECRKESLGIFRDLLLVS